MNKTLLVLRYEIAAALRRKSYLFGAFLLPLVAVLIFVGAGALRDSSDAAGVGDGDGTSDEPEFEVEGYVDLSGIVQVIPPDLPDGILVPYPDVAGAREAFDAGEVTAYYIIPEDYIESGDLIYVNPESNEFSSQGQSWLMRSVITSNLLGNDLERVMHFWNVMDVQVRALQPDVGESIDGDSGLRYWVPYAVMMMFYMTILLSSSLLFNSVNNEKKNQVIEILLVSVNPRQLLTGKILGLGILGLLQTAIWVGTGYGLLTLSGRMFTLPDGFSLPPTILVWGLVFFLLGYAVYASLMAGIGALVPNIRESTQATLLVIWPLIIPMMLHPIMIGDPHGPLALITSLFPFTAPISMMIRLSIGSVPWWQLVLSAVLLLGTAAIVMRAVAGMFHARTLLSGQAFSSKRYIQALLGRL